jgi:chemotaxis protein CheD
MIDIELPEKSLSLATEVSLGTTIVSKTSPLHTCVGASIAVCLFDTKTLTCGLRQVMLPTLTHGHRHDATLNADAALEDVFTQLCPAGEFSSFDANQKRILAKIFGGADLNATGLSYSDGVQSAKFVRSWLQGRRVPVVAESIGGNKLREIILLPKNGVVYCRTLFLEDNFLNEERSQLFAEKVEPNKIELF